MRIVYNKETFEIITIVEEDDAKIETQHGIFYGDLESYQAFIRVKKDKKFGEHVEDMFLTENKLMEINLNDSLYLLQKFQAVAALLKYGDIADAHDLLLDIETDEVLFTQERKSQILLSLAKYLNYV